MAATDNSRARALRLMLMARCQSGSRLLNISDVTPSYRQATRVQPPSASLREAEGAPPRRLPPHAPFLRRSSVLETTYPAPPHFRLV